MENVVPTGLATSGSTIYTSLTGPVPHTPADGQVVSLDSAGSALTPVASGLSLMVDVESGPGGALYALSQATRPATSRRRHLRCRTAAASSASKTTGRSRSSSRASTYRPHSSSSGTPPTSSRWPVKCGRSRASRSSSHSRRPQPRRRLRQRRKRLRLPPRRHPLLRFPARRQREAETTTLATATPSGSASESWCSS